MANRERGEMRLVAGDQTYVLKLTTNACCELEDRSGQLFDDITRAVNKGSVRAVRWMLWASLQHHHADTIKDPKDVGPIIDAAGGLSGVVSQLVQFMQLNSDESGGGEGGPGKRPPAAGDPDGVGSTPTRGSSASTRSASGPAPSGNSGGSLKRPANDSVRSPTATPP